MYLRSLWSLSLFIQIFRILTDKSPSYRNIPVHLLKLLSTFTYKTLIISSHWALPSLVFVFNTVEDGASLFCLLTGMTKRKVVPASVVKQKAQLLSNAHRFWGEGGQVRYRYLVPGISTMIDNWWHLLQIISYGSMTTSSSEILLKDHIFKLPSQSSPVKVRNLKQAQDIIFLSLTICVYDMHSCKAVIKNS